LTLARHPSETDDRMMMRVVAFACHAHEWLAFTEGLSNADEPDLWQKDLTGIIELWVEMGHPDERRVLKACGRAGQVVIYCYANNSTDWWKRIRGLCAPRSRSAPMAMNSLGFKRRLRKA
jgi:uncharacterized protein YaeQ